MIKNLSMFLTVLSLVACLTFVGTASAGGIDDPPGFPLYVIIEVNWDGIASKGDWTVWGPKWDPEVGIGVILTSCTNCLDVEYEFTFRGKTVHFDEIYVPGVDAHPQIRHVILQDKDGDGVYTGSLSAEHYTFPTGRRCKDRIDYEIEFDEDGNIIDFYYLQYEHCQPETF